MEPARIAAHAFMAGIPEEELEAVAAVASEREFEPGEIVIAAVGQVGPGDVIGEVAVLASGRRTASVVATSPIRAISLFKRDVWRLEDTAPEAASRLRATLRQHATS